MGTSNFARLIGADMYYPVLMNYEQDVEDEDGNKVDTEIVSPEHYEYDELKERLVEYIEENTPQYNTTKLHFNESDNDRNRPTTRIITVYDSKDYAGTEIEVMIHIGVTAGYYEGANLDFEIAFDDGLNGEVEDVSELVDWLEWGNMPQGMQVIQKKNILRWITKVLPEMKEHVNKLLAQFSGTKLEVVATFSNGETIYKEVK